MLRLKLVVPAVALLVVCALGSALTRHSHGAVNVLSNIFFFSLVLFIFAFALAAVAAGIGRVRGRRPTVTRSL